MIYKGANIMAEINLTPNKKDTSVKKTYSIALYPEQHAKLVAIQKDKGFKSLSELLGQIIEQL